MTNNPRSAEGFYFRLFLLILILIFSSCTVTTENTHKTFIFGFGWIDQPKKLECEEKIKVNHFKAYGTLIGNGHDFPLIMFGFTDKKEIQIPSNESVIYKDASSKILTGKAAEKEAGTLIKEK